MNIHEDIKHYSEIRHEQFQIYVIMQHEVILILGHKLEYFW